MQMTIAACSRVRLQKARDAMQLNSAGRLERSLIDTHFRHSRQQVKAQLYLEVMPWGAVKVCKGVSFVVVLDRCVNALRQLSRRGIDAGEASFVEGSLSIEGRWPRVSRRR